MPPMLVPWVAAWGLFSAGCPGDPTGRAGHDISRAHVWMLAVESWLVLLLDRANDACRALGVPTLRPASGRRRVITAYQPCGRTPGRFLAGRRSQAVSLESRFVKTVVGSVVTWNDDEGWVYCVPPQ